MWPNPQFPADMVTFAKEIFDRKLHFLCSVYKQINMLAYPWQRIRQTAEKTSSDVDQ